MIGAVGISSAIRAEFMRRGRIGLNSDSAGVNPVSVVVGRAEFGN